jgi:peroxiredoxin
MIMKTLFSLITVLFSLALIAGEGYEVGDVAADFSLKNIDGKTVSMSDYADAKGFVVIFTCNHCPFAKAYEDRINNINQRYEKLGYPVIAINPNDPDVVPEDSYDNMKVRAKNKGFTFPYLVDETQDVFKMYGATRTPHVFVLQKNNEGKLLVKYIGTIDDNYQDPKAVQQNYLSNAIDNLVAGKDPDPNFTKAIGCSIKVKK